MVKKNLNSSTSYVDDSSVLTGDFTINEEESSEGDIDENKELDIINNIK